MFESNEEDKRHRERPRVAAQDGGGGCLAALAAAAMLERACRDRMGQEAEQAAGRLGLYLESVEGLSGDLGLELAALSNAMEAETPEAASLGAALVSAALRAADLATLAACALPELPQESPAYFRAAAAARLASAAAQSLVLEHRALGHPEDYEARDLGGAEWRSGLAARQVEEALQESS